MQYDVKTPSEYMQSLEDDWRKEKLSLLKTIILEQEPSIEESINYKMLCFSLNGITLFHLNAQRNYVSLYCGNISKVDPEGNLLKGLSLGKGCIRFSKTKKLEETGINKFIERAIKLLKAGEDLSC